MNLYDEITDAYPELNANDFDVFTGSIILIDDGDGVQYIAKWEYSKPIPAGMKVGKN